MFEQIKAGRLVILLLLAGASFGSPPAALAQSGTAYDLINAVNALRALHALQPYTVDPWLMAYAQEHSEYQAATRTSTHVHSDGTRPLDIGLQENVASGTAGFVTVDAAVYQVWADWGHRHILTGYATGDIGAGVAFSDDGFVYYTVDIRTGEELAATQAPFVGLQTSTPGPDGSTVHVVGYGETLWSIALSYGVSVDDIRAINKIAGDSIVIQPGQQLLIRPADAEAPASVAAPPTAGASATVSIAASTPARPSAEPALPSPSYTAAPAVAPPDAPPSPQMAGLTLALAIAIGGLSIAAGFGFWQEHKDRKTAAREPEGSHPGKFPPAGI